MDPKELMNLERDLKSINTRMNSNLRSETLPSKKEGNQIEFTRAFAFQKVCIFICRLEKLLSVSRILEETPDNRRHHCSVKI